MDTKSKILDLAMNLNRVGNWAADGFAERKGKILVFLKNSDRIVISLRKVKFPESFAPTYARFQNEYSKLRKDKNPKDPVRWAENAMTWGNILTHRAALL